MKFIQEFEVDQPKERVWAFFDQPSAVAECVPGVESITEIEPDVFTVLVTQSVGPFSATFEARLQITEKLVGERIAFKATGKAVRGAIGNFRAESAVSLLSSGRGTKVKVDSEAALAGVLGSVGQKVIAKQAEKVTAEFAAKLERRLKGEDPDAAAAPARVAASTPARAAAAPAASAQWAVPATPPGHSGDATSASVWMKVAAFAALANLAVTLVILGKLI